MAKAGRVTEHEQRENVAERAGQLAEQEQGQRIGGNNFTGGTQQAQAQPSQTKAPAAATTTQVQTTEANQAAAPAMQTEARPTTVSPAAIQEQLSREVLSPTHAQESGYTPLQSGFNFNDTQDAFKRINATAPATYDNNVSSLEAGELNSLENARVATQHREPHSQEFIDRTQAQDEYFQAVENSKKNTEQKIEQFERTEEEDAKAEEKEDYSAPSFAPIKANPIYDRVNSDEADKASDRVAQSYKSEYSIEATGIYGKILSWRNIMMDEVGIGFFDLIEIARIPNNGLAVRLSQELGIPIENLQTAWDLREAIESNEIMVATYKTPDLDEGSCPTRRLRVVDGARGIFLHPLMSKQYNADFDGDDMMISFDYEASQRNPYCMDRLIDLEGNAAIDLGFYFNIDFFSPAEEENLIDVVNASVGFFGNGIGELVVSFNREWSKAMKDGDSGAAEAAMTQFIRDLYAIVGNPKFFNTAFSRIYETLRRVKMEQVFLSSGGEAALENPMDQISNAKWKPEEKALKRVYDALADGLAAGVEPMNMQELKALYCSFIGEVDAKNITFRFTADIAKMFRFDKRIFAGEEGLEDMLEQLASFAISKKISNAAFAGDGAASAKGLVNAMVFNEVGLPRQYPRFPEFLQAFAKSYAMHSAEVELASKQYDTTFGIMDGFSGVRALDISYTVDGRVDVNLKDLSRALIEVYGDFPVGTIFKVGDFAFKDDSRHLNNPNIRERWGERGSNNVGPWILARYSTMSLRQFSLNNELPTAEKENSMMLTELTGSIDLIFAVADKKTSGLVNFDTKMYRGENSVASHILESVKSLRTTSGDFHPVFASYDEIERSVSFTGQRPDAFKKNKKDQSVYNDPAVYTDVKAGLLRQISDLYEQGYNIFITGGAMGVDQIAFDAVEEFRKTHPDIENRLYIPFRGHIKDDSSKLFGASNVKRMIETPGVKKFFVHDGFAKENDNVGLWLNQRNLAMVSDSSVVVGVWGEDFGWDNAKDHGTANDLQIAKNGGRRVIVLNRQGDEMERRPGRNFKTITSFRGPYSFLSNFYETPVTMEINGTEYTFRNAEAAFQAHKDPSRAIEFVDLDGKQAKRLGRKVNMPSNWDQMKVPIMQAVVHAKFSDPALRAQLDNTAGSLIEGNTWGDDFWGKSSENGQNMLGKILMQERTPYYDDYLQEEADWYAPSYESKVRNFKSQLRLMNSFGPDIFAYFGMDNVNGFLQSRWGRELMKADTVDQIASIRIGMLIEYRLSRITNAIAKYNAAVAEGSMAEALKCENEIAYERSKLFSSSKAWKSIVCELDGRGTFASLKDQRVRNAYMRKQMPNGFYSNWSMVTHDNLIDFLMDPNVPMYDEPSKDEPNRLVFCKMSVLADVMRINENDPRIATNTVSAMLEMNPSPTFSYMPPVHESIMDVVTESNKDYAKANMDTTGIPRTLAEWRTDDDFSEVMYGHTALMKRNKYVLSRIRMSTYGDAIAATLDKQYGQSEKSKQHPWTNVFYSALCGIQNGGMFNDIARTDNHVLGLKSMREISAQDLRHCVLTGEPVYYYKDGSIFKLDPEAISQRPELQRKLLEQSIDSSIQGKKNWQAQIVRIQGTSADAADICEKIENTNEEVRIFVEQQMMDHPTYGGLIALLVPTHHKTSKTMSRRYTKVADNLSKLLTNAAMDMCQSGVENPSFDAETFMREKLGISRDTLRQAIESNPRVNGDTVVLADGVDFLVDEYIDCIMSNVRTALESYMENEIFPYAKQVGFKNPNQRFDVDAEFGMDFESCANFFDVRQELNGAKTEISVGVEGSSTSKLAPFMFLLGAKDNYAMYGSLSQEEKMMIPEGSETSHGPLNDELRNNPPQDLVVKVPEGFEVRDKMVDRRGRKVSSIGAYLIIKRNNGAEKYNLKVKKYGVDEKDSVLKSKYEPVNYGLLLDELFSIEREQGKFAARMYLAKKLQAANEDIGYKDMNLANYMCIAELMYPDTEGRPMLRSVEMVADTIKNSLTPGMVGKYGLETMRRYARDVVAGMDTSQIYVDETMQDLSLGRVVTSKAQINRNYRPMSSSIYRNLEGMKEVFEIAKQNVGQILTGSEDLADTEADLLRQYFIPIPHNYHVTGLLLPGKEEMCYEDFVGPDKIWYIAAGCDSADIEDALRRAYDCGVTVLFENLDDAPSQLKGDLIPIAGSGRFGINMLDARVNGTEAQPREANFASYRFDYDNVVIGYEDKNNEFGLGDAALQPFKSLAERLKINWSGSTRITGESLFPNMLAAFPGKRYDIAIAKPEEVNKYILGKSPCTIDIGVSQGEPHFNEYKAFVDSLVEKFKGVIVDENSMQTSVKHVGSGNDGDIVAWAVCRIYNVREDGKPVTCFAPIIPFSKYGSHSVPTQYDVLDVSVGASDGSTGINVNWKYSGGILGQFFKMHEWTGAANKMMFSMAEQNIEESPILKNGIPVDVCYAQESTASRRGGSNKRIKTMESMMWILRKNGYNFAESERAFPNPKDAELKERLRHERIPRISSGINEETGEPMVKGWDWYLKQNVEFCQDEAVNKFIQLELEKFYNCGKNPSDYLATSFDGIHYGVAWEFPAMFASSSQYQDMWMKFFNIVDKNFCPFGLDGIYDEKKPPLFVANKSTDKWENNCLQMQISHKDPNGSGKVWYTWENVYAGPSFFGDEFSGFHSVNVNGSSTYMDALNTMALSGLEMDNFDLNKLLKWSLTDSLDPRELDGTWLSVIEQD